MVKRTSPVTIGLPVYNGVKYLEGALRSILSQTHADFTLIICDNASTDRTQEICQTFAAQDDRIWYFRNEENIGIARNFNRVFSLSESQYFKWAACDDLLAPEFLEVCKEILDNEPEVILAYPKTKLINAAGEVIGTYEDGLSTVSRSPHGRFLQVFHNLWLVNPAFGLIRSEAIKKTHLYGNYPNSDLVFLAELSLFGQFREVPYYLFFFRFHPSTSSGLILSDKKVVPVKTDKDKLLDYIPNESSNSSYRKKSILFKHFINVNKAHIQLSSKILLSSFLIFHTFISVLRKFNSKLLIY